MSLERSHRQEVRSVEQSLERQRFRPGFALVDFGFDVGVGGDQGQGHVPGAGAFDFQLVALFEIDDPGLLVPEVLDGFGERQAGRFGRVRPVGDTVDVDPGQHVVQASQDVIGGGGQTESLRAEPGDPDHFAVVGDEGSAALAAGDDGVRLQELELQRRDGAHPRQDPTGQGRLGEPLDLAGIPDEEQFRPDRHPAGIAEHHRCGQAGDAAEIDDGQVGDLIEMDDRGGEDLGPVGEHHPGFVVGPDDVGVGHQMGLVEQHPGTRPQVDLDVGQRRRNGAEHLLGRAVRSGRWSWWSSRGHSW